MTWRQLGAVILVISFVALVITEHESRFHGEPAAAAEIVFDTSVLNERLGMFQTPNRSAAVLGVCTDLPGVEFCVPCQLDYLCVYRAEGASWDEVRPMVLFLLEESTR